MVLIPASLQPYAKAVVATVIFAVGVAVQLLWIDSATGTEITGLVTGLAALLGVVATPAPGYVGPPKR